MKKVKVIFATAIFTAISLNAVAQQKSDVAIEKKQEVAAQFQQNQDRLALSKEQQVPYREITKRYAQKMKDLRGNSLEKSQKLEALQGIISEKNAEMKTLLTPEQYKIYLQIQEERKAKMMEKRKK